MALEVIGPGFGRTGTASLKIALEMLGLGPCHHMHDVVGSADQRGYWRALAAGRPMDWDQVFAGYRSQVDWPGAHPWRELAAAYPEAKVVLSIRPEESWWKSFSATIGALMTMDRTATPLPPQILDMLEITDELIVRQTFACRADDREGVLAAYRKRIQDVREAIAPERLLVFDVSEGWEPLCRFLNKPIPDTPFPHSNTTEDFWKTADDAH
jgi:hypothetical protein